MPRPLRGRETARGKVPARLAPVFLDTAEATPGPDLGEEIRRALQESRTLVVLCSPAAVRSEWVDREIEMFRALGREDRIFCVLVDGEPGAAEGGRPEREAFPVSIRDRAKGEEPLAADLREGRSRRVEVIRLVAGLAGLRFDELFRRERRRRRRRLAGGALAAILAGAMAVPLFLRLSARSWAREAEQQEDTRRGLELARRAVGRWEAPETEQALRDLLERHRERIRLRFPSDLAAAAVGPDGAPVAVIDAGGRAAFWDPLSGEEAMKARSPTPGVDHLAFSGDGSRVVGWGVGTRAFVWDARTGASVASVPAGDRLVWAGLDPAGERLLTVDRTRGVGLWALPGGSSITTLTGSAPALHAAFGPGGRRIATGAEDGTARVFDLETGTFVTLSGHDDRVGHVAFDPSGTRVVTSSYDRTAAVWDARTGKQVFRTPAHDGRVMMSTFSVDGGLVATVTDVGLEDPAPPSVRLWDAATGTLAGRFDGHDERIVDMAFGPEGDVLVTASSDSTHVWLDPLQAQGVRLATLGAQGDEILSVGFLTGRGTPVVTAGRDGSVRVWDWRRTRQPTLLAAATRSLAFPPSGDRILTGGEDGTVRLWNAADGTLEASLPGHEGAVVDIAVSPDGRKVATVGVDGTARIRDLGDCTEAGETQDAPCPEPSVLRAGGTWLLHVAFDGNGHLATGDREGTVVLWDAGTGLAVDSLHTGEWIDALTFAPGGGRLALASGARALVWTPADGREPVALDHEDRVNHVAFSPGGKSVLTASDDATAKLWDADTGALLRSLAHDDRVLHVAWTSSGTAVVTACADGTARVWRAGDGVLEAELRGHLRPVTWVGVTPAEDRVITANEDGTALLWSLDGGEPVVLPGGDGPIATARIGPDGRWLATLSADLVVRTWALPLEGLVAYADSLLAEPAERVVGGGG